MHGGDSLLCTLLIFHLDPDQGLSYGVCERHHVLQGEGRYIRRGQRGRLQRVGSAVGRHHPEVQTVTSCIIIL